MYGKNSEVTQRCCIDDSALFGQCDPKGANREVAAHTMVDSVVHEDCLTRMGVAAGQTMGRNISDFDVSEASSRV
jgi:hypothetical protein